MVPRNGMKKPIDIFENFYSEQDFGMMMFNAKMFAYNATYQPKTINFPNRLKAYPCYETGFFTDQTKPYNIFKNTFENLTNLKIKKCKTFFRKIISEEVSKSPISKYGNPSHTDNEVDLAGVIYLNSFSLDDGTRFFSDYHQIEPDLIVGSKPNRMVLYSGNIYHSAGYDPLSKSRLIQPFFINLEK